MKANFFMLQILPRIQNKIKSSLNQKKKKKEKRERIHIKSRNLVYIKFVYYYSTLQSRV